MKVPNLFVIICIIHDMYNACRACITAGPTYIITYQLDYRGQVIDRFGKSMNLSPRSLRQTAVWVTWQTTRLSLRTHWGRRQTQAASTPPVTLSLRKKRISYLLTKPYSIIMMKILIRSTRMNTALKKHSPLTIGLI